ncbi:MAG: Na+/H+ antiporter NhaA, partial [Antricoccus sp.]
MTRQAVTEAIRYLRTEAVGGIIMLVAAIIALILANSGAQDWYHSILESRIGPHALHLDLTVSEWFADGLLAIFFFVVGLELKRELVIG